MLRHDLNQSGIYPADYSMFASHHGSSSEGAPVYNINCLCVVGVIKPLVKGAPFCGAEIIPLERDPVHAGARIPMAFF